MPKINSPKIKSVENADEFLLTIAVMKADVQKAEAEANTRINKIQEECVAKTEKLRAGIESIEQGLEAFAEANKKTLFDKDKRSVQLNCGTIGYRESRAVVFKDAEATVSKLKDLELYEAINITEKPKKEVIENYDGALLKQIGAKVEVSDNFFYKTKEKPLAKVKDKAGRRGK